MGRAADAVAEIIGDRAGGRAHVVGFSLGAQVGVQLLATRPHLVDRAVLCGTIINTLPGARSAELLAGRLAGTAWFRRVVTRRFSARRVPVPPARTDDYRDDLRLSSGPQLAHIVAASVGFAPPEGFDTSDIPALFLTGAEETVVLRRWAAALAKRMPNGIARVAIGMRHDWPLQYPNLFSRTVENWLCETPLPEGIVDADARRSAHHAGSRCARPAAR